MTEQKKSKGLNVTLWIAQILLAVLFIMTGLMKAVMPIEQLAASMQWVTHTPPALVRFIGIAEILGAVGLIIPSALRIQPKLTAFAALGLVLIMLPAIGTHFSLGEYSRMSVPFILMLIAIFILWGILKKAPIEAK